MKTFKALQYQGQYLLRFGGEQQDGKGEHGLGGGERRDGNFFGAFSFLKKKNFKKINQVVFIEFLKRRLGLCFWECKSLLNPVAVVVVQLIKSSAAPLEYFPDGCTILSNTLLCIKLRIFSWQFFSFLLNCIIIKQVIAPIVLLFRG